MYQSTAHYVVLRSNQLFPSQLQLRFAEIVEKARIRGSTMLTTTSYLVDSTAGLRQFCLVQCCPHCVALQWETLFTVAEF
jgi:hypothetical protein